MSRENEGQTLRDYKERRKRRRRRRMVIIIMLLLVLAGFGGIYLFGLYHRTYESFRIAGSTPNTEENLAGYLEYNGAVVRYSRDGAVATDSRGGLLWNGSYEMQDPIADVCGEYVAVADRGGRQVRVYNGKGEAGAYTAQYDIKKIQVASQGVTAVLMEDEEVTYIRLFDKKGEMLTERITHVTKDGYVMDIALSDDGKKLAAVFLSVNKGEMTSIIVFYNFGEYGKNLIDFMAGSFIYKDIIAPRVVFLDNNTACVYKEDGLVLYNMPEIPEYIMEETMEQRIKSVVHNNRYTGLVLEGEDSGSSRLVLYNLEGKKVLDKKLSFEYSRIFISGEEIIMYNNLSCMIMKTDGKVKFTGTFTTDISAIYPVNHLNRYLLVTAGEILDIELLE